MSYVPPSKEDVDREVHDLLTFLHDFEIRPPSAKKASKAAEQRGQRRPLGTLKSNRLFDTLKQHANDDGDDDDSLTTSTSVKQNVNFRQSWANRMSRALGDWKDQHDQWTDQRLFEQRRKLESDHTRALQDLRNELHEHYRKEFRAWKVEFLSSLGHEADDKDALTRVDTDLETPFADKACDGDNSSTPSRRQRWKSPDGKLITRYHNGTWLEKDPNGSTVTRFSNGDIQTTGSLNSPTKLCYYYHSLDSLRMDQVDGSVIWIFPSGQKERHFPDGTVQVTEWATVDEKELALKNVNL